MHTETESRAFIKAHNKRATQYQQSVAYDEGQRAATDHWQRSSCPYTEGSKLEQLWLAGFDRYAV